ncbi:germ cell nuclear acidic protein-like isoform X2 [Symsagittifera roscoffensis]|uniref:germ cell nuclear acidic protein-like isoform X2 n=1 Tax=Symsagittifera roscoffensis TaxID=84072 RepID=UPI00307B7769
MSDLEYSSSGNEQLGELTFYTCYDDNSCFPDKRHTKEPIWSSSLSERERTWKSMQSDKSSYQKIICLESDNDQDTVSIESSDLDDEIDVNLSPLPLRERLLNPNNCCKENNTSNTTGNQKNYEEENVAEKKKKLDKENVDDVFNCSAKPLLSSTRLDNEHVKGSKLRTGNLSLSTFERTVQRHSISTTDESDADAALEDLFIRVKTPKGKSISVTSTSKTKKDTVKKHTDKLPRRCQSSSNPIMKTVEDDLADQLQNDKIDPSRYAEYIGDFHFMSNRQLQLNRDKQTRMLFTVFNETVFENMFSNNTFKIEWNKNLTSTAGRTNCVSKKEVYRNVDGSKGSKVVERFATIELATKILDSADRLRDTLIHEMCHAAVWVQTGDRSAGHGPLWKKWANWATLLFPSLPNITRCHNYAINYKFYYICTQCHSQLGRFSKSVDLAKQVCGRCHGKFQLVRGEEVNKWTELERVEQLGNVGVQEQKQKTPRTPNVYAQFIKDNWTTVQAKNPGMPFAEVRREINKLYHQKNLKKSGNHEVQID